jgi:hypothetical protein
MLVTEKFADVCWNPALPIHKMGILLADEIPAPPPVKFTFVGCLPLCNSPSVINRLFLNLILNRPGQQAFPMIALGVEGCGADNSTLLETIFL